MDIYGGIVLAILGYVVLYGIISLAARIEELRGIKHPPDGPHDTLGV